MGRGMTMIMPPEWAPQDWLWIGFPHLAEEWPGWLEPAQVQMAAFASAAEPARIAPEEAARLAAVLPSPKRYNAARPGPYVRRRTNAIQRQMRYMGGSAYLRTLD